MPLSATDVEKVRQYPQVVKKYFSYIPEDTMLTGTIVSYSIDSETKGVHSIGLSNVNLTTQPNKHSIVYIGITLGGEDVGRFRVRSYSSNVLKIEEISESRLPELGVSTYYVKVVDAFTPTTKLPRIVASASANGGYNDQFTEYHDYDESYVDQNIAPKPKANVTGSATDKNVMVKYAGFVDDSGSREITLYGDLSEVIATDRSITGYAWDIKDGTLDAGSNLTDSSITVRFPPGHRYITLTVTDSNSNTGIIHVPIWAHDDSTYIPLEESSFQVTSHSKSEGQSMTLDFKGNESWKSLRHMRPGTMVIYWEDDIYFGEDYEPADYNHQFLGWVKEKTVQGREDLDEGTVIINDAQAFMAEDNSFSQLIKDVSGTPALFSEMKKTTLEKVVAYVLQEYTNLHELVNVFYPGLNYPSPGEDITPGNLSSQLNSLLEGYLYKTQFRSDSSIHMIPIYSNMPTAQQDTDIKSIMKIEEEDIRRDGISVRVDESEAISYVLADGSTWDFASQEADFYYSFAPSRSVGIAGSSEKMPAQRLPTSGPSSRLNDLSGQYYAARNIDQESMAINLCGNLDVFNVGDVINFGFSSQDNTVAFIGQYFEVLSITINHSTPENKWVSLSCKKIVRGKSGESYTPEETKLTTDTVNNVANIPGVSIPSIPIVDVPSVSVPDIPSIVNDYLQSIGIDTSFASVASTTDMRRFNANVTSFLVFSSTDKTIRRVVDFKGVPSITILTSSGNTVVGNKFDHHVVDYYCPLYSGTGTTVEGWVSTNNRVYKYSYDINGTDVVFLNEFNPSGSIDENRVALSLDSNFLVKDLVICNDSEFDQIHYSFDGGINWTTAGFNQQNRATDRLFGCALSRTESGIAYFGSVISDLAGSRINMVDLNQETLSFQEVYRTNPVSTPIFASINDDIYFRSQIPFRPRKNGDSIASIVNLMGDDCYWFGYNSTMINSNLITGYSAGIVRKDNGGPNDSFRIAYTLNSFDTVEFLPWPSDLTEDDDSPVILPAEGGRHNIYGEDPDFLLLAPIIDLGRIVYWEKKIPTSVTLPIGAVCGLAAIG